MTDLVAGIDIGGTKTAAGLVDPDGQVVARLSDTTPGADGAAAIISTSANLVRELRARLADLHRVVGVGVGSAGVIDTITGFVLSATEVLTGWAGTDLRGELALALGVPVAVDNDVHAHAVGEAWRGAAAGVPNVLFIAAGTGIGASIVLQGKVLHGAHSVAGHAGHIPSVQAGDLPCPCGGRGHLEAIAAGPAMLRQYERLTGQRVKHLREVAARASAGEREATVVIQLGATALGDAIGALVNVLDPDLVIVSGGVTGCGPLYWDTLRAAVRSQALPTLRDVPVEAATLGNNAAIIGAARLAWEVIS